MFQWSSKTNKSVHFSPESADQALLAVVEAELAKQPHKTFSDLCKDTLWRCLCAPESVKSSPVEESSDTEPLKADAPGEELAQQVVQLQHQVAYLEQRFLAGEASRLEMVERQLQQLTLQLAQLAIPYQPPIALDPTSLTPTLEVEAATTAAEVPAAEEDPLLDHISPLLNNF